MAAESSGPRPVGWTLLTVGQILLVAGRRPALAAPSCCSADRKIWAGVQMRKGPNVVGPVRPAAVLRRPREVRAEGDRHPRRGRQGGLPAGAADQLHPGLRRLGGDPARARAGWSPTSTSASSTCSPSPRSASTASSWAAGRPTRSIRSWARLRSAAQMVSYEVSIGFVIVTVILLAGSMNLQTIVDAAGRRVLELERPRRRRPGAACRWRW